MNTWSRTAIGAVLAAGLASGAAAEESVGARLFAENCAACHGTDGKGNGPLAELLSVGLPDLTTLSARNDGTFPFERVFMVVDGRADVAAHGGREMPVWGMTFDAAAAEEYNPFPGSTDVETFVSGRILALVSHIQSLQE